MINRIKQWLGLHIHDWSNWVVTDGATWARSGVLAYLIQRRTCKTCGLTQMKKEWPS